MSATTNPPVPSTKPIPDPDDDSFPPRPKGIDKDFHNWVRDHVAMRRKRPRTDDPDGSEEGYSMGKARGWDTSERQDPQNVKAESSTTKRDKGKKTEAPKPEHRHPSRRWPPPPSPEPHPKAIVPLSHFRAQPMTGPRYSQPASHSSWRPYTPGPNIPYKPRPIGEPAPPVQFIMKVKKGQHKKKPVKPKPSLYKYELGRTYKAWMAPPNYHTSTFEAYAADAQRFYEASEARLAPPPVVERPPGWVSPAQRCSEEILENIFEHLYQLVQEAPLPCVPIKGRDPWMGTLTNERLTNGEKKAYKTAIMRKSLYDYGLVCKSWWCGTQKGWNEVVIVGERDAERALQHINHWIPVESTRHLCLTLQMTIPSIHRLLRSFAHAVNRHREKTKTVPVLGLETREPADKQPKPADVPIPIRKLTLLHSFEPEDLGELHLQQIQEVFALFAPYEFDFEFYGGDKIIERKSLDTVARALRWPWGYFGAKEKFRVVVSQEDEMDLLNAEEGGRAKAYVEEIKAVQKKNDITDRLVKLNRKLGLMKKVPAGKMSVETIETDPVREAEELEKRRKRAKKLARQKRKIARAEKAQRELEREEQREAERELELAKPAKKKAKVDKPKVEKELEEGEVDEDELDEEEETDAALEPPPARSVHFPSSQFTFETPVGNPWPQPTAKSVLDTVPLDRNDLAAHSLNVAMGSSQRSTYNSRSAIGKRKRDEEVIPDDPEDEEEEDEEEDGDDDNDDDSLFDDRAESGPNEDSMMSVEHAAIDDPWLIKDNKFDPATSPGDRIAGYIYLLEQKYLHLPDPALAKLKPDERKRREIWAELFGESDDLRREWTVADRKWLQIADRDRMPQGWIPPLGWKINNPIGAELLRTALEAWMMCMKVLVIRGHWMNVYHEIKRTSKRGVLEEFHYHFIPLPAKTISRSTHRRKPHRSPNPPLGALKSLDNILMWDFRERPEKWYRKLERKRANEAGENYEEPPEIRKLKWACHVPFDMWIQQKDRRQFKGNGRGHPWVAKDTTAVHDAIKKVIMEEGDKWEVPQVAEDDMWSNQRYFDEMINFVINVTTRKTRLSYPLFPFRGPNLWHITYGATITPEWLDHHVARHKAGFSIEKSLWQAREERWFNEPEPEADRRKWCENYLGHYLAMIGEEGRKEMMQKLRKKHGAKRLWERCNWDLGHPNYPGVTIKVEMKGE